MRWQAWLMFGWGSLLGGCGSSSKDPPAVAESCEPGSTFCKDRQVWACDGDEPSLVESCTNDEECREEGGDAHCRSVCFAEQPTCDDDFATVCAADGSGPEPGGEDCSEKGQVCELGECVDADCTPGKMLCRNGDVYVCGVSGKDVALIDICMGDEICDPVLERCGLPACEAGARDCDQSRIVECSATGTGWQETGVDCAAEGEVCIEGECEEATCSVGSEACMDNAVYACPTGVGMMLVEECTAGRHCLENAATGSANCAIDNCVPGNMVCHLNLLKQCTEQGMFPTDGIECEEGTACAGGACQPVICEAFAPHCEDGDIYACGSLGVDYVFEEDCAELTCGTLGDTLECVAPACTPGETACVGNAVGECADDGESLVSVSEDCAVGGNVCDPSHVCAPSVVDTLGTPEFVDGFTASEVLGNLLDVHSSRRITALEANLVLDVPRDLRWVIGAWNGTSYDVVATTITTSQSGSGYFSSGALDYELEAGQRYLLGVGLIIGDIGYLYYEGVPWNGALSFATAIGVNRSSFDTTLGPNRAIYGTYSMRLTTELP